MLEVSIIELFTRGILEGFLFVLANYAIAKKKVVPKPYILSSAILIVFTFGIRLLDINFGVHTVLNLICLIFLCVFINKIDIFSSVKGSMVATLLMFMVEVVNVVFLKLILGDKIEQVLNDPYQKAIAGVPGILLFGVVVLLIYRRMTRKKEILGSTDGTTGN